MYKRKNKMSMKKETLEEAAEKHCESITHPYCDREKSMFIKGAKWQQEQDKNKYSEEEVLELIWKYETRKTSMVGYDNVKKWFEQFKKK